MLYKPMKYQHRLWYYFLRFYRNDVCLLQNIVCRFWLKCCALKSISPPFFKLSSYIWYQTKDIFLFFPTLWNMYWLLNVQTCGKDSSHRNLIIFTTLCICTYFERSHLSDYCRLYRIKIGLSKQKLSHLVHLS